jgi:hypothetical protein
MKKNFLVLLLFLLLTALIKSKAQLPVLNSLPNAPAVIFLDFDGHTVTGTSWNYSGPIVCAAAGLTNSQVTEIFNRVAEDYRPFDVNITTDSVKYLQAPYNKRIRALVTVTSAWYGASAGGVSFVGSFTWGDDTPCFIFSQLFNYNVKNIGEACAHEIGHTLGLYHQASYDNNCVKVSDYNYGNGSGEIGWAPIMGVGYYRNLTLWNNGANPFGCTNYQDDLTVISTQNGFGFRSDDYPETFSAASSVTINAGRFTINGIVEKNTDKDMFKITIPSPGHFHIDALPYNVGSGNNGANLDLQVILYNNAQTIINTYNPGTLLGTVIDTNLLAGVYYIRTEGRGNIYAPDYASLGQYTLQGIFTSTAILPLRKLLLQGRAENNKHILNWEIDADEAVITQTVEAAEDGLHFSPIEVSSIPGNRSFVYIPLHQGPLTYRLKVLFDSNREFYSNTIFINKTGEKAAPKLVSNMVQDNVLVMAPGRFDYSMYNSGGNLVRKGILSNGTNNIGVGNLARGIYYIQASFGPTIYKMKFIKN